MSGLGTGRTRLSDRLKQLSDIELVELAKKQLPYVTDAYEIIFQRYHNKLLKVCIRYLKSAEEAEETVNDTLLILYHKIDQFEGRSSLKTWLFKIAHNQALTKLRKKQLEVIEFEDEGESQVQPERSEIKYSDKQQQLNRLLDGLSLDERSIIVFRMTGDLGFSEIAEITDQKESTVKMKYKRAIEKMASKSANK